MMRSLLWMLVSLVLAVLTACGGGGSAEPSATPSDPVVGATGGTVTEASGAQVTVPAGAFRTPTTLRIAQDSTGAPALPAEVRIPLPGVALRPNQAFMLAKADPAG